MIVRLTGHVLEELPIYHEHGKPAGIAYGPVMTAPISTKPRDLLPRCGAATGGHP